MYYLTIVILFWSLYNNKTLKDVKVNDKNVIHKYFHDMLSNNKITND